MMMDPLLLLFFPFLLYRPLPLVLVDDVLPPVPVEDVLPAEVRPEDLLRLVDHGPGHPAGQELFQDVLQPEEDCGRVLPAATLEVGLHVGQTRRVLLVVGDLWETGRGLQYILSTCLTWTQSAHTLYESVKRMTLSWSIMLATVMTTTAKKDLAALARGG